MRLSVIPPQSIGAPCAVNRLTATKPYMATQIPTLRGYYDTMAFQGWDHTLDSSVSSSNVVLNCSEYFDDNEVWGVNTTSNLIYRYAITGSGLNLIGTITLGVLPNSHIWVRVTSVARVTKTRFVVSGYIVSGNYYNIATYDWNSGSSATFSAWYGPGYPGCTSTYGSATIRLSPTTCLTAFNAITSSSYNYTVIHGYQPSSTVGSLAYSGDRGYGSYLRGLARLDDSRFLAWSATGTPQTDVVIGYYDGVAVSTNWSNNIPQECGYGVLRSDRVLMGDNTGAIKVYNSAGTSLQLLTTNTGLLPAGHCPNLGFARLNDSEALMFGYQSGGQNFVTRVVLNSDDTVSRKQLYALGATVSETHRPIGSAVGMVCPDGTVVAAWSDSMLQRSMILRPW